MPTFLLPRLELTPDQLRVVELPPSEHRIMFGPPGSGKTQILIHRAANLRDTYRVDPERFRILVFTNVITDYIRSALQFVEIPEACVMTFDRCVWNFIADTYRRDYPGTLRRKARILALFIKQYLS
jgi:hypothetical protein